jgi:F-type H+-transporting ATPase subunit alpha
VSAYIPTNVISITDGQIFLESDLFFQNVRPAVNVGISVSRVGGNAQTKAMKKIAGTLRLDLASYRELAAFAQFGADLDKSTQQQLARGARLVEILKQPQYRPVPWEKQVILLMAGTRGLLDEFPLDRLRAFEVGLYETLDASHADLLAQLREKKALTDEIAAGVDRALRDHVETFRASLGAPATSAV